MPRRYTMATLEDSWKQLADLDDDDSIASAVWRRFANLVYGEGWAEVTPGDRYFETSTTITADGSDSYDEPEGHFTTIRVTRVLSDGTEIDLQKAHPSDEERYRGTTGDAFYYTLVDDQLFLYPTPSSGTYKWHYSQQPTDISGYADGDVVDVVCPALEQFLAWGVVALALHRQQKNVTFALQEKEKARVQLQHWAANRDLVNGGQRPLVDDGDPYPGWPP